MASDPASPNGHMPNAPLRASERLIALDFIRGVAVLGILFANIVGYAYPLIAYSWPPAIDGFTDIADRLLWLAKFLFIDGKMRGLFTLLFGAGLVLFLEHAWARDDRISHGLWLQARRLLWLMLIGLAHFFLLYWGDILFLYSIAGLVALTMVRWDPGVQLRIGIAWYVVGAIMLGLSTGGSAWLEQEPAFQTSEAYQAVSDGWDAKLEEAQQEQAIFSSGSYPAQIAFIRDERTDILWGYAFFAVLETMPLMLIGMGLYRHGLFSGGLDQRRQRFWGWIALGGGLLASLPLAIWPMVKGFPPMLSEFAIDGATQLPHLAMVLGLAALLPQWSGRWGDSWLGRRLVAAGRMALSNYVGTSLLMLFIFRGWALGMFGQLGRVEMLMVVLLAWAAMLAWSRPWLNGFRYGPLEWVWRCLTYWRLFPMRK